MIYIYPKKDDFNPRYLATRQQPSRSPRMKSCRWRLENCSHHLMALTRFLTYDVLSVTGFFGRGAPKLVQFIKKTQIDRSVAGARNL